MRGQVAGVRLEKMPQGFEPASAAKASVQSDKKQCWPWNDVETLVFFSVMIETMCVVAVSCANGWK